MNIIAEKAMVKTKTGNVVECKVALAHVSGGKQVQYISADGKIIRTEKLSRSPYRHQIIS
ncbi:hypothetical protein [Clostridium beijerinckii]|uniref:Uncharacterized protein n=1 Tax=Clostridium beijerinckii TaxID=1520 RepID=A0AAW3W5L5_CLOBE|nr:hypothetical protein [Clostridium beijerinckii]MBC2457153.1 hypothetical protein [Clostridium beijerinckii]MBC2474210.1 hypothetical protein [Clostridium beijerinckii]NOV58691.1 hypothetical protein [Clostridium beijerinckii]NOV71924.1 hypothetical protein [Clostridium beijerinckii]NOW32046.1 hypothetical protein [Clostridium beijerinckii]